MSGNSIIQLQVIPPAEYVYALRRVADQRIKVGHTVDIVKRLQKLANDYGDFDLLGVRYGTEADENTVRDALRPFRVPPKHDWFYTSRDVYQYIQDNFAVHAEVYGVRMYEGRVIHIAHEMCNCGYDHRLLIRDRCYECAKDTLPKHKSKRTEAPIKYLSKFDYWLAEMQQHKTPLFKQAAIAATARPSATANESVSEEQAA